MKRYWLTQAAHLRLPMQDGVIVQLTADHRLVFCVWIALRNPPFHS